MNTILLTERDLTILRCVASGLIDKETGVKLGIAQQSVKNRVFSIMLKLGAKTRTEAVVMAIRRGELSVKEDLNGYVQKN